MGEVITYDSIYDALRKEKFKGELQKLDKEFLNEIANYIAEKRIMLKSQEEKDSIFASSSVQKTRNQLVNTSKIIKELYNKRESKIIQLALFSAKSESQVEDYSIMLDEEKELYEAVLQCLKDYRKDILHKVLEGVRLRETVEEVEEEKSKVSILLDIKEFVGEDLKSYGPFQKGDIVSVPEKIKEVLIRTNKAEEI